MAKGLSFYSFGAVVNASAPTLNAWKKRHEDFGEAAFIGEEHCRMLWEKIGIAQAIGDKKRGKGSAATWIFNMKNRFKWADRNEVELGENAKNILTLNYTMKETKKE